MRRFILSLSAMLFAVFAGSACTNFLVGKKASADGSVFISYSADSYGMSGFVAHFPAATYPQGAMRDVYDWDTGVFLGQIPEVRVTYNVLGNINEHQVAIAETTFGGRPELVDTTGIMLFGFTSAFFHELGHITAPAMLGIPLRSLDVGMFGASLKVRGSLISYSKEFRPCFPETPMVK